MHLSLRAKRTFSSQKRGAISPLLLVLVLLIPFVKRTENHSMMKLHGMELSNNEIVALYVFATKKDIERYFIRNGSSCRTKQLFRALQSGITKIHRIFILENRMNQKLLPHALYHEFRGNPQRITKQKKSWRFTTHRVLYRESETAIKSVDWKQSECLLSMEGVDRDLYRGDFVAAPIDWIVSTNHNNLHFVQQNQRWICAPTEFQSARFERRKNGI